LLFSWIASEESWEKGLKSPFSFFMDKFLLKRLYLLWGFVCLGYADYRPLVVVLALAVLVVLVEGLHK